MTSRRRRRLRPRRASSIRPFNSLFFFFFFHFHGVGPENTLRRSLYYGYRKRNAEYKSRSSNRDAVVEKEAGVDDRYTFTMGSCRRRIRQRCLFIGSEQQIGIESIRFLSSILARSGFRQGLRTFSDSNKLVSLIRLVRFDSVFTLTKLIIISFPSNGLPFAEFFKRHSPELSEQPVQLVGFVCSPSPRFYQTLSWGGGWIRISVRFQVTSHMSSYLPIFLLTARLEVSFNQRTKSISGVGHFHGAEPRRISFHGSTEFPGRSVRPRWCKTELGRA